MARQKEKILRETSIKNLNYEYIRAYRDIKYRKALTPLH